MMAMEEVIDIKPMKITYLTVKQQEVCDLLAQGLSNKEIASTLGISRRTVECHREVIFKKMKVRNAVELVRKILGSAF